MNDTLIHPLLILTHPLDTNEADRMIDMGFEPQVHE